MECSNRFNQDEMIIVWTDPYGHYDPEYICTGCYSYKTFELQDSQSEPTLLDADDVEEMESED